MNGWEWHMVWSGWQVTAFLGIAAGMYALLARWGAGPSSTVLSWFLGMSLGVLPLSCCPWPDWWPGQLPAVARPLEGIFRLTERTTARSSRGDASSGRESAGETSVAPPAYSAPWRGWLQGLVAGPQLGADRSLSSDPPRWTRWAAWLMALGIAVGVFRFLMANIQLVLACRRAVVFEDRALAEELGELAVRMACRHVPRIGLSPDLTTAATVGWRQPILLLPRDWQTWTEEERRAVLAHELAHVRRRDFVAWWIAQLALALYWYHPGMHQLVRRLQLQQEIAADALAVMTTQDPHRYLKVLAAMWLRHDDFLIAGLAQRFLATTSTFSTRIAMLRVKDGPSTPGISRWLRNCIIAVSAGSTLLTATFRTGAADERPSSELTRPAASDISPAAQSNLRDAGTTPTVPVPSSRVPLGVLVVRPAQFFRLAGTEPWLSPLNREIAAALRDMTEGNIEAHADYVEEAVLLVRYDARLRPNGDRHSLSFELESLQAARGVDVAACFQRVFPGAVTKRGAQATIHLAPPSDGALNFLAQAGAGDARRMAFVEYAPQHVACRGMKPDEAEAYAAGERHWQSSTSAFPDWPRLEASTLRFALNDQLGRIAENADPDDPWQSAMQPLLQKTSQILGTIDLAPELSVQIDIQPRAETSVKQLEDTVADILARARAWASVPDPAADASSSADPSTAPSAMPANSYMETVRAVIQSARVESSAERIRITARAALPSN